MVKHEQIAPPTPIVTKNPDKLEIGGQLMNCSFRRMHWDMNFQLVNLSCTNSYLINTVMEVPFW